MATQNEILERLDTAATNAENATDAYNQVLTTEGEQDILLVDGTTTPNLNKRLKGIIGAVKSVQGKTGEIVLLPKDIMSVGSNNLNATPAEDAIPELVDNNGTRDPDANAQAQSLLNRIAFIDSSKSDNINSINELAGYKAKKDGQIVNLLSYHAGRNCGGDLFMWSATMSKSLHDGGYFIDPTIPVPTLATFNTYYAAVNSTNGVWVRLNNKSDVAAENYGIHTDPSDVWACAAVQAALYKAASFQTPKNVTVGAGIYRTTNPIIISKIHPAQGSSTFYRVPKLIGAGRGSTEFIKTTTNNVGTGYLTDNVDAVIFVCPKDGDIYSMYDGIEGIAVYRYGAQAAVGYGFYLRASIYGDRRNLRAVGGSTGYFQTDCWMSQANNILTDQTESLGIGITSGTSVMGRNLYATNSKAVGIDITALTYSDLSVHADGCGTGSPDGANAIQGSLSHGTRLLASTENHKGTEFYFTNSRGVVITGRSYNTAAVTNTAPKIKIDYDSNVIFNGYDWEKVFNNLSAAEAAKYTFLSTTGAPNYAFPECTGNDYFKDFPYKLSDGRINSGKSSSGYREEDRTIYSKVLFTGTTYKKAAYVADCARFFIVSAICTNSAYDRYFTSNSSGFRKASVSTNSASPTRLDTTYVEDGVTKTIGLWGYIDANGWLWVRNDVAGGNNLEYQFTIRK